MKRALAVAFVAALAACSQSHQQQAAAPSPSPSNQLDFPLYGGSDVVASQEWHRDAGTAQSYGGVEVIAQTPATLAQLNDWIHGLSTSPPSGYTVAASGSGLETARRRAEAMGVDFQVFSHDVNGKHHALVVVAVDPQAFDAKAGPMLSMVDKYKMLPQGLRDPIDSAVKQRIGYTVSDVLSPSTPVGAAYAAIDRLRSSGQRGVVLVDGAKE